MAALDEADLRVRNALYTTEKVFSCDCTARSVLLTLVGAGGRAARPPRAPGRARAGRRQPQLDVPVRARRAQRASKPKRVARRNPPAPTTCVPTPRGRQRAVPAAREGGAVAPGDGQGRALPAPNVRRPPRPARPGAAGLGERVPRNVAAYAAVPVSFRRCRLRAPVGAQRRDQGHVTAEGLSTPGRAIDDEVQPASVIWRHTRRGSLRQPLL